VFLRHVEAEQPAHREADEIDIAVIVFPLPILLFNRGDPLGIMAMVEFFEGGSMAFEAGAATE
jgi:hypothetical protein